MQEIIVYRNPAEAAFWHALTNSELSFPMIVGFVTFIPFVLFFDWFLYKISIIGGHPRNMIQKFLYESRTPVIMIFSMLSSVAVVYSLTI